MQTVSYSCLIYFEKHSSVNEIPFKTFQISVNLPDHACSRYHCTKGIVCLVFVVIFKDKE